MIATLRCACGRVEEITLDYARAAFHFDQVVAEHGWQVQTIFHLDGSVEANDLCPQCLGGVRAAAGASS
jgi:hypothetical protein